MKTWRRVDGLRARAALGATSAREVASADMARRARMAAFRGLWWRLIRVLIPVKERAGATVAARRFKPANS